METHTHRQQDFFVPLLLSVFVNVQCQEEREREGRERREREREGKKPSEDDSTTNTAKEGEKSYRVALKLHHLENPSSVLCFPFLATLCMIGQQAKRIKETEQRKEDENEQKEETALGAKTMELPE